MALIEAVDLTFGTGIKPNLLYLPEFKSFEVIKSKTATLADSKFVPHRDGHGVFVPNTADCGVNFGIYQPMTYGSYTVAVVANPKPEARAQLLLSQRINDGGAFRQFGMVANNKNSGVTSGAWGFYHYSGGSVNRYTNGTWYIDGQFHVFVVRCRDLTIANTLIWYDGKIPETTTSGTSIDSDTTNQKFRIGNYADHTSSGAGANCSFLAAVVWPQAVPSSAIQRWQTAGDFMRFVQRPSRRLYVDVVGAAPPDGQPATKRFGDVAFARGDSGLWTPRRW